MSVSSPIRQMLRRLARGRPGATRARGQAIVEFALASTVFLLIIFGTIDFGRVIFTYSMLHNAVREGARYGKVKCGETNWVANTKDRVIQKSPGLGLTYATINVTSPGGCVPPDGKVTVAATTTFTAVTQSFLGISPITLNASATVYVE